jgi:hypothetical protein
MIRVNDTCGGLTIHRLDVFKRYGDGCYLVVFVGGERPTPGSISVTLSRDQAQVLAAKLLDTADELGPGVMERGRDDRSFSYRLRRP